jgi:hypothetical protein
MTGRAGRNTGQTVGPVAPIAARRRFGRARWDPQPTQAAAVLIASTGEPIPLGTIRIAVERSGGEPIAVVSIARIYGSNFGLPNPGLMPTRRELAVQYDQVQQALAAIERAGVAGWAQVTATRRPAKAIAAAARARGARHILVVHPTVARWRQIIEGDLVKDVVRRVPAQTSVEGVRLPLV